MRTLATLALAVMILSGCGGNDDEAKGDGPQESSEINVDAWRDELVATGETRADPDMEALEEIAREDCATDVDSLALRFSLAGATPDLTRIGMKYVCPDDVGKVDEALEQLQGAMSSYDEACAAPENLRTEEQRQMIEAVGPC